MNESWDWEATRGVEARSAVDKQIHRPTNRPTDRTDGAEEEEGRERRRLAA
jgi:hypothetical protein